jgi:hypothetical protein
MTWQRQRYFLLYLNQKKENNKLIIKTMEEDFKFSMDYHKMFADAKKIKNIDRMAEVFNMALAEVGIIDPASNQAQAAAGKAFAEYLNDRDAGKHGKKV